METGVFNHIINALKEWRQMYSINGDNKGEPLSVLFVINTKKASFLSEMQLELEL